MSWDEMFLTYYLNAKVYFLDIDFVTKVNAKKSRHFDLPRPFSSASKKNKKIIYIYAKFFIFYSHLKMVSERSKHRDFLALTFITKVYC